MTEFPVVRPVWHAYGTRMAWVWLLSCLGTLNASASGAGPFEEFERRCLLPMENVQTIGTDGLRELPDMAPEPGTRFVGQALPVGTYFVLVDLDSQLGIGCGLGAAAGSAHRLEKDWLNWEDQSLRSKRYIRSEQTGWFAVPYLESTFREPRIQVMFLAGTDDNGAERSTIFVLETDLES